MDARRLVHTDPVLEASTPDTGVHVMETVNIRAARADCGGFNHGDTGLYMEAAHCKRT